MLSNRKPNKVQAISMKKERLSSTKQQEGQNKHFCVVLNIEVPDNPVDVEETNQIHEINSEEPSFLAFRNAISKTKKENHLELTILLQNFLTQVSNRAQTKSKNCPATFGTTSKYHQTGKKDPMIKVPKKGNLKECKNWRRINLLQ